MRQAALTLVSVFAFSCLPSCTGGDEPEAGPRTTSPASTSSSPAAPSSTPSSADLTIAGGAYDSDLVVAPGATVTVHNTDPVAHNVVAEDGSFRIDHIAPDQEATFTAPLEPGQYPFVCTLQPGMRATLTVPDPAAPGPAPGEPAPDPAPDDPAPGEPAPDPDDPAPATPPLPPTAPGGPTPGY